MRKILASVALVGLLSGCASILTPHRCETALSVGHSVEDFLALLRVQFPLIAPEKAQKLAEALHAGVLTLEAACAQANPVNG